MDELLRAVLEAADEPALDRGLRDAARGLVLETPPTGVQAGLLDAATRWAQERRGPGRLARLFGVLVFDSATAPLVAGVRGVAVADARQLVYECADAEVAFTMAPDPWAPGAITVDGQLLVDSGAVFTVHLLIEGVGVAVTVTDDLGQFRFEGLDRGPYQFVFSGPGVELHVGPIPVDDREPGGR